MIKRIIRYLIAVALIIVPAYLLFIRSSKTPVEKLYEELELQPNPTELTVLQNKYSNIDMDAGVRFYQKRYGQDAIYRFARDLANDEGGQVVLDLCRSIRVNGGKLNEEQASYINAMANVSYGNEYGEDSERQRAFRIVLKEYTSILEKAQLEGGVTAEVTANDALSVWLYKSLCMDPDTASREAWNIYCQNREWMPDAVALMYATYTEEPMTDWSDASDSGNVGAARKPRSVEDVIRGFLLNCGKYEGMKSLMHGCVENWREATEKNEPAPKEGELTEVEIAAFMIPTIAGEYAVYGDVLDSICNAGVPADKALDMLLLNQEFLDKDNKKHFIDAIVKLWNVAKNYGDMEQGILNSQNIVQLFLSTDRSTFVDALKPHDMAVICPMLIYMCLDEQTGKINNAALGNALKAMAYCNNSPDRVKDSDDQDVTKFLPIMIFSNYLNDDKNDRNIVKALANDWRSVLYLIKHREDGMERLLRENWKANIDYDFEPDGTPIEHWVEYFPFVGSIFAVGQKILTGVDCTWGDLGWAAFDIADTTVTIISFVGTAGTATAPTKGATAALKSKIKTGFGKKVIQKTLERDAVKETAKVTGKVAGKSVAYRMVKMAGNKLLKGMRKAKSWIVSAGHQLGPILKNRKFLRVTALSMLGIKLCVRTIPNIDKVFEGVTHDATAVFCKALKGIKDGVTDAVCEALGLNGDLSLIASVIIMVVSVLLAIYILFGKEINALFTHKRNTPPQYT